MEHARDHLEALVEYAVRAPSGDNTQPWQFVIDPERARIALRVDEKRDPSPMNAGQRMSRIAVGAALENMLFAATLWRWTTELEPCTDPDLAVVRLVAETPRRSDVDDPYAGRATNRRLYEPGPIPTAILESLERLTPILNQVSTHWIVDRGRLASLAELIGRADALMFAEPSMRQAFLANVRFDAPANEPVAEGLSLASLELSAADRVALRLIRRIPDWLFPLAGFGRVFAAKARTLVTHAAGLCLVVAPDGSAAADVDVGRAMHRAWLALTGCGLAVQPMMSLLVLANVLENASSQLVTSLGRDRLTALGAELRALVPEIGPRRAGFLMRFGFAPPPSGRTGRRPIASSLVASQL